MELQDGFIVGIYNYCDRWCEACAFTSRCRSFAMEAEIEARLDASMRDLVDARRREPMAAARVPVGYTLPDEFFRRDDAKIDLSDPALLPKPVAPEHEPLQERAETYAFAACKWLEGRHAGGKTPSPENPFDVIAQMSFLLAGKVYRALFGLANVDEDDRHDDRRDCVGSAKVAVLAAERSHAAWLALVERGSITQMDAEPFIGDLVWIGEQLDRVFPHTRAFIRPAFDEAEAVARLR